MKSIITLLTIAALSFAPSVFAQEEPPATSTEEKPSATVETPASAMVPDTTPEPTPAPVAEEKPASTPAPKKKETSASTSTSSEKKKESAAASPAKKKASTGPDKGSAESNVKRLENEWEEAIRNHDTSFAEARVANDFIGCSSKGKILNKSGLIKEIKNDKDTYTSAKNRGVTVRAFGSNVAVGNGTSVEVGKSKDGKAFKRTFRWSDTWMLRGGQWQCIASHVTLVADK